MAMLTGNGEKPQVYGKWTTDDLQNWLFANRVRRRRVYQHGFSGLSASKYQGTVPRFQVWACEVHVSDSVRYSSEFKTGLSISSIMCVCATLWGIQYRSVLQTPLLSMKLKLVFIGNSRWSVGQQSLQGFGQVCYVQFVHNLTILVQAFVLLSQHLPGFLINSF